MTVKKLRQVFLVTSDLEAQVHFYQETLGLEPQFRDGDRWVQFQAGDVSFALASLAEGQGAEVGAVVPVFELEDLDLALSELAQGGHKPLPVRDMGTHGRTAAVDDPAGVRVVLFQRQRT